MKVIRIILLSCLVASACAICLYAETDNTYGGEDMVKGNIEFALDLYNGIKNREGNLFFSPYSISTALAMTYAGARGNTEKQMADVLHFTLDQEKLHAQFAKVETQLNNLQKSSGIELNVANSLWAQEGHNFLDEFISLTNQYYSAGLNRVDFKKNTEAARKKINAWVEDKTKDKIKDLIPAGMLSQLTRLVLANAIYFKATWESQFNKRYTQDTEFWLSKNESIKAPLMFKRGEFQYAENDKLQVLELPYKGNELSMIILLPKEKDGLSSIESMLNNQNLQKWTSSISLDELLVYLPKFKATSTFLLARTFSEMGMSDAFDMTLADFSGMDGVTQFPEKLSIDEVIHKAFIDVNEEGTEAAAATAVITPAGARMSDEQPSTFRADHPFIFLIRHNASGSILFLGRVVNPNA